MPRSYRFTVPGIPVGKGRARFVKATGRAYTPRETAAFEDRVRLCAREAGVRPIEGPVTLTVVAWFPCVGSPLKKSKRPAKRKTSKPDASNIGKAVEDALNGIAYKDDSQVWALHVEKWNAAQGDKSYTEVTVTGGE